jgi:hypothetical protein
MRKIIAACFLFSCIVGCKSGDEKNYSEIPELTFVSATPSSLTEYSSDVEFIISYTDGDGDLGENNDDIKNLFLTDNRINIIYQFRIQQLAPSGSGIPIKGNLKVILPSSGTGITDGSTQQSGTFSIYCVDRAGNQSNTVTSSLVTFIKP